MSASKARKRAAIPRNRPLDLSELERNPKEHKVMEEVAECMKKLNNMGIRDLQGRSVRFAMQNGLM